MAFKIVEAGGNGAGTGARFFKYADWDNKLVVITSITDVDTVEDQFRGPDTPTATIKVADVDSDSELQTVIVRGTPGVQRELTAHQDDVNGGGVLVGRIMKVKTKRGNDFIVLNKGEATANKRALEWLEANLGDEEDSGGDSSSPWKK